MVKNIIFLGPPGSGKGTQIEKLRKYFDLEIIATGDIARALSEKDESIKKTLEKGELLNDEAIIGEIEKKISQISDKKGLIFDGFPRNINQAKTLDEVLLCHGRVLDAVIYLFLDEEEVIKRLTIRQVCENCGYPLFDKKICPKCGGKPITRQDDSKATIINRMQIFLERTLPLVSYYESLNILIEINGQQTIEEVAADVKKGLQL